MLGQKTIGDLVMVSHELLSCLMRNVGTIFSLLQRSVLMLTANEDRQIMHVSDFFWSQYTVGST